MLYIGTSFGGCLRSMMDGEVCFDEVMFIVTNTRAVEYNRYMSMVRDYYDKWVPYDFSLQDTLELAEKLWKHGKIHQPRIFVEKELGIGYRHPFPYGTELWLHVAPLNKNKNPAVVNAWEQYKMLDTLTKDE